tara:strand:- start:14783 stop:15286 length:504 start_codon:yes stop_codon:yes gene_type:complete
MLPKRKKMLDVTEEYLENVIDQVLAETMEKKKKHEQEFQIKMVQRLMFGTPGKQSGKKQEKWLEDLQKQLDNSSAIAGSGLKQQPSKSTPGRAVISGTDPSPLKGRGSMAGIGIMEQINRSNAHLYTNQVGGKAFDDELKTLANTEWPMTPDEAFKKEETCPRRKLF